MVQYSEKFGTQYPFYGESIQSNPISGGRQKPRTFNVLARVVSCNIQTPSPSPLSITPPSKDSHDSSDADAITNAVNQYEYEPTPTNINSTWRVSDFTDSIGGSAYEADFEQHTSAPVP